MLLAFAGMLLAAAAHAEPLAMEDFKKYLVKLRDHGVDPMDAYIMNPEGERITLRKFRGKPVLLHFWATWCAPCIAELPKLAKLGADMDKEDLQVVAVSEDFGGIDKVKEYYKRTQITTLTPYADVMTGLANTLDITQLPVTIILDKDGKIIGRTQGAVHWDDTEIRNKMCELIN